MPRFTPNPAAASVGFPVYPAGDYEIILGEPKAFFREGKEGKGANYGVAFRGTIGEGENKGKPFMVNCYQHTPESENFAKQVQMAALGFSKDQEDKFNAEAGSQDWSFDTDNNSCGESWHKMKGARVIVTLDVKMADNGDKQQSTKGFRPLS